ncbi:hypothetical protein J6590_034393, partial [Homalodisca vitripennis]
PNIRTQLTPKPLLGRYFKRSSGAEQRKRIYSEADHHQPTQAHNTNSTQPFTIHKTLSHR